MKKIILLALVLGFTSINAQTVEELKAQKAEKQAEADKFQGEANALQAQIDKLPGWRFGAFGTIGANLQGFNDWYSNSIPNGSTGNIGVTVNGFANLDREKFFWRNAGNANLAWLKADNKDLPDELRNKDFEGTTDVFNISSLYGYKLSDKWAVSALGEFRSSIIDNFNNPGYLDVGVGVTWTPIENLFVVIHPLNYNFVFTDEDSLFESSAGAKFVADYTRAFGKVNFKSNLSGFYSYKEADYSNWTWVNSLGYTLWKGIGLGFEFGLRGNKQEAFAFNNPDGVTLSKVDNKVQSYWLFGLSYSL
jgi:hypothetical protein